jgi:hypothetical protein
MSADPTITRASNPSRAGRRLERIPRGMGLATCASAILALAVVLGGLWIGWREVEAARVEAARLIAEANAIRAAAAEGIGPAQAETEGAGTTSADELERFAMLRERLGIQLAEHHDGRPVIIVPEGRTIRPWSAPSLAALSRFNGRMFRVVEP